MVQTKTVSLERFKNAVGFTATYSVKFGNTRKAFIEKMQSTTGDASDDKKAKTRLQLKKQLIISPQYEEIKSYMGAIRTWIYERTVPSFFKEGFQLCGLSGIDDIERRLRRALEPSRDKDNPELPDLVAAFVEAYPAQVLEARSVLEPVGQFNAGDYPAVEDLPAMFGISWNWISFGIPEQLPPELRQAESDKLERTFADAGEQITAALRAAFAELIKHATEKLETAPGEKPKVFRDSMIGNLMEFIGTFNNRNITNDVELAMLVSKAKSIVENVTPQKLRDFANVRQNTLAAFKEIEGKVSEMIVQKPSRRFDFGALADQDQDQAPAAAAAPVAPVEGELVPA